MPHWKPPISSRRFEVFLLYPLIGGVAVTALGRHIGDPWRHFLAQDTRWAQVGVNLAGFIVSALATRWCIRWFRPNLRHLKNTEKHPTALLSVPIGYTLVSADLPWSEIHREQLVFAILSAAAPPIVFIALWWQEIARLLPKVKHSCKRTNRTSETPPQLVNRSLIEILNWTKSIEPIRSVAEDLFDAKRKASLLVTTLSTPRGDEIEGLRQSVAILGRFGSGKTSVVNLTREMLESAHPERFIFVEANCWGFESSAKAKEHVLDLCVEALSDFVDCNPIRRLPSHYGEAVNGTPGWAKPAATFALAAASPTTQLQAFGSILAALDSYLVVVIEDADRNGKDFDTGQILALLHHLRSVPRISFIVSATRDTPIELFKVAEQTVFIESPDSMQVLAIMNRVRDSVLTKPGYIDPDSLYGDKHRPRRPQNLARHSDFRGWHLPRTLHWAVELTEVVGPPRILKAVLQDFQRAWFISLSGEVDPDQLLIALSLRHGAPNIFDFLCRYSPEIRALPSMEDEQSRNTQAAKEIKDLWQRECAAQPEAKASAILVAQLFPKLAPLLSVQPPNRPPPLQTVSGEARYWQRIVTGAMQSDEIRDQVIFGLLVGLQNKAEAGAQDIASKMDANPSLASEVVRVEAELRCLGQKQRLAVVSQMLVSLRTRASSTTTMDDSPWADFSKWIPEVGGEEPGLSEWLEKEIAESLPIHLSLAAELVSRFISPRLGLPNQEHRGIVMLRILRQRWRGLSTENFATHFSLKNSESIKIILFPILNYVATREPLPVEDAWLPELLLSAIRSRPDPMLPLTVLPFYSQDPMNPSADLSFSTISIKVVKRFFGSNERLFYSSLVELGDGIHADLASSIKSAVAVARSQLSDPAPAGELNP